MHALDGGRTASSLDLGSYGGFILTEAIADDASAGRFFLPYGDAKIDRCERVVRTIEVDHLARGDRTKPILSGFEALKGDVGEQRLHRQEIHGRTVCLTCRARKGCRRLGGAGAAAVGHVEIKYPPWSALQGQAPRL
ncbi:MAG TPA: hypothetical protein VHU82_12760 [Vicinamibacterales bacterium]|nr:hypothetical protein [Vicinamibacterales bacterium]